MCAPCVATAFPPVELPAVELPLQGLHQVGAARRHRGIEAKGGPPHPHVNPHGGPLGRRRIPEHMLEEVEHHGCGAR